MLIHGQEVESIPSFEPVFVKLVMKTVITPYLASITLWSIFHEKLISKL